MTLLIDAIFIGFLQASPLILAAMGFTLIFYLNGFMNIAYAETITFGAYAAILFNAVLGAGFYLSIVPAALSAGGISVLVYLLIFRPAMNRGVQPTEMIILSVGVSFMLRYGLVLVVGQDNLYLVEPNVKYLNILGQGVTNLQLIALGFVALSALSLTALIYRTGLGESVRGLANNYDLAIASGINPHRTSVVIWFVAGCAGGLSGVFSGVFSAVNPLMGWNVILVTIMVTIVAGIGSVRGAVLASIVAGILTAFITLVTKPLYADVVLLAGFIGILSLRGAKRA
ncbi:branched-chain amino acid ABC transporter permease [Phaeobacter italicus]|jgi:branched-subunit amino acid ABC-type transport system permease component|uniref:branched-chain amino acid ABC transporter permease n=1 Tax=Phaeobacter italicus TaxID=481446 RepID=UPI002FDB68D5